MYQSGNSQSVDGGLPSKTPVSLLQELCMRRGISPKYDLLQIEGPVHEPTFVYRVTVGEYAANGSGQTKKKAKHAAAKAVLDIIIQGGSGSGQSGSTPEISSQIVSPYDDGIPGNPVGALQELCMSRRWPPPTYELTSEEGFPHERTFSICCTIGNHKEIGAGKSKKLSKRQAANKMLQKLKDQPVDHPAMNVLADDDDEVNKDPACSVAEGSCPSLTKACTTASFSILKPKRVCPHLSDISLGSYQVCENCFKYVCEIGQRYRTPFQSSLSLNQTVNGNSKIYLFNDENVRSKQLSDLQNDSARSDNINCGYTESDISKLEEMFDKLTVKHSEKITHEHELIRHIETDKEKEIFKFNSISADENNDELVTTFHTVDSNDNSSKSLSTPRIIKGILHNINFENVENCSDSNSHLYSSDH